MSVDPQKLQDAVTSLHQLWALPLQVAVTLVLLWREVRLAFVAGLAVVLVMIPLNGYVARRIGSLTETMMKHRDDRVGRVEEAVSAPRALRLQGLESAVSRLIGRSRSPEMAALAARKYLDAVCVFLWASTPVLVSLATFGAVVWIDPAAAAPGAGAGAPAASGTALSPSSVFVAVSLLGQLIFPMNALPWVLAGTAEAAVSLGRLGRFVFEQGDGPMRKLLHDAESRRSSTDRGGLGGLPTHAVDIASHTGLSPVSKARGKVVLQASGQFEWFEAEDTGGGQAAPTGAGALAPKNGRTGSLSSDSDSNDGLELTHRLLEAPASAGGDDAAPLEGAETAERFRLVLPDAPEGFCVLAGECVAVVGRVGSGKSALLRALCGHLRPVAGGAVHESAFGEVGWAPQSPWVREATVLSNVDCLAGSGHQADLRVVRAISAAQLDADAAAWPAGLGTAVKEGGDRLSGGQRKRVALARALSVARCRACVLDAPLDALDATVARAVFDRCLASGGGSLSARAGMARVLSTHDPAVARRCDRVVALVRGRVVFDGSPSRLSAEVAAAAGLHGWEAASAGAPDLVRPVAGAGAAASCPGPGSVPQTGSADLGAAAAEDLDEEEAQAQEARAFGAIQGRVCASYCAAVGTWLALSIVVSLVVMQATRNGADWWLAQWSAAVATAPGHSAPAEAGADTEAIQRAIASWTAAELLSVLAGIAAANALATLARSFLFAWGGLRAARVTHDSFVESLLSAPLSVWDARPAAQLLNRASRDQFMLDETLPFQANILLAQAGGLIGTLAVIAYATGGWFLTALPPVAGLYACLQRRYRTSSRELRRLDSLARSPLYAHFSSCAGGVDVLRAAGPRILATEARRCDGLLDESSRAWLASALAAQWLGLRLQVLGVVVILFAAAFAVGSRLLQPDHESGGLAGMAGLALSYAIPVVGGLQALINSLAETEKEMVAVERIDDVIRDSKAAREAEADEASTLRAGLPASLHGLVAMASHAAGSDAAAARFPGSGVTPHAAPAAAVVKFDGAGLRYPSARRCAVTGVSLEVRRGDRVGVIGRTGAGKTTALLALSGAVGVETGSVLVMGADVRLKSRQELLRDVGWIPQSPFLFRGSVMFNVDPSGGSSRERPAGRRAAIVEALETCGFAVVGERSPGDGQAAASFAAPVASVRRVRLNEAVEDWSAGERQLLSLARALLNRTPVLCVDEATSAVDEDSSERIRVALERFVSESGATALIIAHRASTLASCNRFVHVAEGRVREVSRDVAMATMAGLH